MKPLGAPDHPGREPVVMSVPVASGEAAEEVMDVGLKHDEAGGYRIFFQSQAWDDALNTKDERTN